MPCIRYAWRLQHRQLIPAPVDRTCVQMYRHARITCQKISQAHQFPTQFANQSYIQLWGQSGTCGCIPAHGIAWQLGMRSCITPWQPIHLVQESTVSTVVPALDVPKISNVIPNLLSTPDKIFNIILKFELDLTILVQIHELEVSL